MMIIVMIIMMILFVCTRFFLSFVYTHELAHCRSFPQKKLLSFSAGSLASCFFTSNVLRREKKRAPKQGSSLYRDGIRLGNTRTIDHPSRRMWSLLALGCFCCFFSLFHVFSAPLSCEEIVLEPLFHAFLGKFLSHLLSW